VDHKSQMQSGTWNLLCQMPESTLFDWKTSWLSWRWGQRTAI
jgi:hypothetical protein